MRQVLRLHPDSLCFAATHVEAEVVRPCAGGLVLCYFVTGKISDLRMPPVTAAVRTDELWQLTCFEAFVRTSPGAGYYEFNFAPSTQWAAYRFSSYRSGMRAAIEISAPRIEVQSSPERHTLQASLALDGLSMLPRDAARRISIIPIALRANYEIWHRSTHSGTRFARAASRQARCIARAPRFDHRRPDARARCAGRVRRHQDRRRLRSAARAAWRQAR